MTSLIKHYTALTNVMDWPNLTGPIDEVIQNLQELREEFGSELSLELDVSVNVYHNNGYEMKLTVYRPENAEEETVRRLVEMSKKYRRVKKSEDEMKIARAQYEALKKRFGD